MKKQKLNPTIRHIILDSKPLPPPDTPAVCKNCGDTLLYGANQCFRCTAADETNSLFLDTP